jgi:hypothetical protein
VTRLARDEEIDTWNEHGWVLLDGLIGKDEIDAATGDLRKMFPTPAQYHADPEGETEKWIGRPPAQRGGFTWPETGPGFRPEQHRWASLFPWPGTGALNRLSVHPSIVDFMERALRSNDLRLYQAQVSAKFTGITNYEQPMHTDRNHSWLPALTDAPIGHVETFLYLSDVSEGYAPTHLVSIRDSVGRASTVPLLMPDNDPEVYAAERPAIGPRGSLLAYRSDVFHRGVNLTAPEGFRFLMNVSYRLTSHDWIGYHSIQSRASSPHWVSFVERSAPRELELFGFPPPGHPIWNAELIEATATAYPKLDLTPWRSALESTP